MFSRFFLELRAAGVPASLTEYLTLLEAMDARVVSPRVEDFYYLSRSCLVKDERHIDRFDTVFSRVFAGTARADAIEVKDLPEEWLRKMAELHLSKEEMERIEQMGGWDKIMDELRKRLEEQGERHQGGSKWIGTAGTSPYGAYGYNPAGVRIGQAGSRHRRAVKVWERRDFKNFDDSVEIGTRNLKVALRRLRKMTRTSANEELDLPGTIRATADNAGWLDLKMRPERHNAVKVLLLLDVGGSMDDHIRQVEELFSAARSEFKHLEVYYFHNCLYERVWRDNSRRRQAPIPTWQVLHTYGRDYKVIFVGDASMSPFEVIQPGGSVEHWNEESGWTWMQRFVEHFQESVWLNPVPRRAWQYTESIDLLRELVGGRMFPLTIAGLEGAMRELER